MFSAIACVLSVGWAMSTRDQAGDQGRTARPGGRAARAWQRRMGERRAEAFIGWGI